MNKSLLTMVLLAMVYSMSAQTIEVRDESNQEPVPGVLGHQAGKGLVDALARQ